MTGSYGNNMKNRWEEFVGDVRNMRGRFPLTTMGVLFLVDHSILGDNQFARLLDMLRKLRLSSSAGEAYDATCLVIAQAEGAGRARLRLDEVPDQSRSRPVLRIHAYYGLHSSAVERVAARQLRAGATAPTVEATPPPDHAGPPALDETLT